MRDMLFCLYDMVRNDEILVDDEMNRYTMAASLQRTDDNETDFELTSDRLVRKYPGYILDEGMRIVPGPGVPVVSFKWLKELLLSKDLNRNQELDWANEGQYRFLDGDEDLMGNMVAL